MEWFECVIRSVGAVLISYGVTRFLIPLMMTIAQRMAVIDRPDGILKTHKIPTPYLGGIAVYLGFIAALALFFPIENNWWFMAIGTTLLLFVGLIDDLIVLAPSEKWWGQIVATICFVRGGFYLKEIFLLTHAPTHIPSFLLIISFVWILTIINAFNLIDVMDGLATTVALTIAGMFAIQAFLLHQYLIFVLLAAIVGALIAFLQCNKPQASIYLGDSGSLFLGGLFAIMPFMLSWGTYQARGLFAPLLLFFIPLVEIVLLVCIRTSKNIPFYQGSPDHFCLYLKKKGWSIQNILCFVVLFSMPLLLFTTLFVLGLFSIELFLLSGIILFFVWNLCIFGTFQHVRLMIKKIKSSIL